jgi:hypothetical protein
MDRGERAGVTLVEYLIVAGAGALSVICALRLFGNNVKELAECDGESVTTLASDRPCGDSAGKIGSAREAAIWSAGPICHSDGTCTGFPAAN